jgi:hypothetical protein
MEHEKGRGSMCFTMTTTATLNPSLQLRMMQLALSRLATM